jgi:hypothetical protein
MSYINKNLYWHFVKGVKVNNYKVTARGSYLDPFTSKENAKRPGPNHYKTECNWPEAKPRVLIFVNRIGC